MSEFSNVEELEAMFDRFDEAIDFTRPGREESVGQDILDNQALRILQRAQDQQGTDGKWEDNRGEYKVRKDKQSLIVGVGLKSSGQDRMLSLNNVRGERQVTETEATMTFGQTDAAKDKGNYFTHGSEGPDGVRSGAKNQPPRHFYGITEEDEETITRECAESVGDWLLNL